PFRGGTVEIIGKVTGPAPAGVYTNTASAEYQLYDLTLVVTDSLVYTVSNSAPYFTSAPVTVGTQDIQYDYAVATEELNGEVVTITATTLPGWLGFTDYGDRTALLEGTPGNDKVGQHSVVLEVVDSAGLASSQSFTITISNANDAPVFTSAPVTTATQDIQYTYAVSADDPDLIYGDILTISSLALPGWLELTDHGGGAAILSGIPANGDVGDHSIVLQVADSGELTGTQAFTITVANANDAPEFTSAPVTTAAEGAVYTYTVSAADTDLIYGDNITITAWTLPNWLGLTDQGSGSATLSGTPGTGDVGVHAVVLRVTDSGGLTGTQSFSITVAYINDAPAITSTPVTTATEKMLYSYNIAASDPDLIHGDALTITAPGLPGWLNLIDHGSGTATLSGTPSNLDVGDHAVQLQVIDSGGLTGTQVFSITVANANDAPVFTSIPVTAGVQGMLYTYAVAADDPDLIHGDLLTITALVMPDWLALEDHNGGSATLSGTPTNDDVGDHSVVFRVTDSGGLTGTQTFSITIANVNDAPIFTSTPVTNARVDSPYTYLISADDPDLPYGDHLLITAPTLPVWLTLSHHGDGTTTLNGTPTDDDLGDHDVMLRVTDDDGLTDTQSITITVGEKYPFRIYLPLVLGDTT
ncbi:MAG: hypothetical protein JXA42_05835, partial [Anaerolineales bacterium]|nr:hypothetical protein [Anaerolineales bacterium]